MLQYGPESKTIKCAKYKSQLKGAVKEKCKGVMAETQAFQELIIKTMRVLSGVPVSRN